MPRLSVLLLLAPVLSAQTTGTVEGAVVNSLTNAGIAGAEVQLISGITQVAAGPDASFYIGHPGQSHFYKTTTGLDGTFQITGAAEGGYQCLVSKNEFATFVKGSVTRPELRVAGGQTARLEVELAPWGRLRGRVLDIEGRPVAHAKVEIAHLRGSSGNKTTADADGRFDLSGMGTFTLMARPANAMEPPPSLDKQSMGWAATYYPRAIERADAERIVLRPGPGLDGYDLRLLAVPVYRIRGIVLNDDGSPAAGVIVRLFEPQQWDQASRAEDISGKGGTFEFRSVWARDWELKAESQRGERGVAAVTVSRADVDGLVIRLSPTFSVEAQIEFPEAGGPKPRSPVTVLLEPEAGLGEGVGSGGPDGKVQIDGLFPGRYRIDSFSEIPGYYLDSVLLNGRDVTGQAVELSGHSGPITIIFKPNPARITGTVEKCEGQTVVLWQFDEPVLESQWFHQEVCDARGHFDFTNLRPGDYYAYAFESIGDHYLVQDLHFARALRNRTAVIHVAEGETANIELKLAPWPE